MTETLDNQRLKIESPVREWRPKPSRGGRIGAAVTALALVIALGAALYGATHPIAVDVFVASVAGLAAFLLALAAGLLTYGYRSLRYRLEQERVVVEWLGVREIIPLESIEGLFKGQRLGRQAAVEGIGWPGYRVGRVRAEGVGWVKFYGTSIDPADALLLGTGRGGYAFTPADLSGFRSALLERLETLPEPDLEQEPTVRPSTVTPSWLSLWRDGLAISLMAGALAVLLASFGHVASRFPYLPALMPLHFDQMGTPDIIGPPTDAFRMPLEGLVILLANLVVIGAIHRRQRDAGRILAAATLFVELVMLVAVLRVVH